LEKITDEDLEALAPLRSLEALVLGGAGITDKGIRRLTALASLRDLMIPTKNVVGYGLGYLARLPSLEYLTLSGETLGDDATAYLGRITSLKGLDFYHNNAITGAGLRRLRTLTNLEDLDLYSDSALTGDMLAELKAMPSLKRLDIRSARADSASMAHLKEIKTLEWLHLPDEIADKGLAEVAQLGRLKCVRCGGSSLAPISDAGLKELARLPMLERLDVGGTSITDTGMAYIAQMTNLRRLSIFFAPSLTNEGMSKLAALKSLEDFSLGFGTSVTLSGLTHLNALPNLRRLQLHGIQDDSGLNIAGLGRLEQLSFSLIAPSTGPRRSLTWDLRDEDLACLKRLTNLRQLQAGSGARFSDAGMAHLAGLTNLEMLNIGGDRVTDHGLSYLVGMKKLSGLMIRGNITDRGLRYLEELPMLSYLQILPANAATTISITAAGWRRLQEKLPNLRVSTEAPKAAAMRRQTTDNPQPEQKDHLFGGTALGRKFWRLYDAAR
jgi:Leucine-rich repeat (LRR) protein